MATTPSVTIKVGGKIYSSTGESPADAVPDQRLYMLYTQATMEDKRTQWVVFPPARKEHGAEVDSEGLLRLLSREQAFAGNRSKWFHSHISVQSGNPQRSLDDILKGLSNDGWTLGPVVIVPLEKDDYREVWKDETPHKALRAVDRALRPFGIQVK